MTDTQPRRFPFSPDAGTDQRFPHWAPEQQQHEARRAVDLTYGRPSHLARRWTPPRGGGFLYYGSAARGGTEDLISALYAVVLHEQPELTPDPAWLASIAELADLGAIDTALYDVDRAARLLAGNAFGDSRHSPGTDGRISAWLAATEGDYSERARRLRSRWRGLHTPFRDGEGYPHVILPWSGTRQCLDAVLMATTGGIRPGTRVRVTSGPHAGKVSAINTAWWEADGPPTGYLLQGGSVPYSEPFPPDRLTSVSEERGEQ